MNHPPDHRIGPRRQCVWTDFAVDDREALLQDLPAPIVLLPNFTPHSMLFAVATWRHHATMDDARLAVADDQQGLHADAVGLQFAEGGLPGTLPGPVSL